MSITIHLSESQLSQQLSGLGHLSMRRLLDAPQPFVRELALALLDSAGGERPLTARDVLAMVRPEMLRATLGQEESCV